MCTLAMNCTLKLGCFWKVLGLSFEEEQIWTHLPSESSRQVIFAYLFEISQILTSGLFKCCLGNGAVRKGWAASGESLVYPSKKHKFGHICLQSPPGR
ncbi:hypothetical protein AVEN_130853-1 [Araneus ventricosus]|uniref:Uncharacterized protein n=1 Tax=Araneus ventricosus TaxID=182803 RepID=A0A4Y2WGW6_ARAVE|nr:hypothetical protein AVEN_59002-1 [Araneus ventricosus]GBO36735.1 hypothetical protein AVEN_99074-1 [Araneus ventricosus]GBO36736.1 hypothetical protein AVEN_71660-1 [Araneus ventricosus]GBO36741.1 hypothetical protein AVEN_130853-1 [Araneus ventricosus]